MPTRILSALWVCNLAVLITVAVLGIALWYVIGIVVE